VAGSPAELSVFIEHNLIDGRMNFMVKVQNVNDSKSMIEKLVKTAFTCYEKVFNHKTTLQYTHY